MRARFALAALAALGLAAGVAPTPVAAHPLGNFTINQFSRLEPGTDALKVTYVVDMAEIPTFQERQAMDLDADGSISELEESAYLDSLVPGLVSGLHVEVGGDPEELQLLTRDLTFSPGAGDLPTMRLELELRTELDREAGSQTAVTYRVANYEERLGWRQIIVTNGPGTRVDEASVGSEDPTDGLRSYPEDLLQSPPDIRSADFTFSDASGTPDGAGGPARGEGGILEGAAQAADPLVGLFSGAQTPFTAGLAILVSIGLGALHAASPGHGKTLVAAYLVGSHGELRQAVWLALTVAVTHTAGVFVLGVVTLTASELFVPERVITWLAVASGAVVIVLGGSLVLNHLRRAPGAHSHDHGHDHGHTHDASHSHDAPLSRPLTRRSAIALGLAGGLVPSASALIVFLLALTLGRLGFGVVLIVSFGAGMALVLGAVGFVVVIARRAQLRSTSRWSRAPFTRRLAAALPLLSGVAVLATGIVVTLQAATRLT